MQPSAPPLYPRLGNEAQVFWLQRVNKIANKLRVAIERSENTAGNYKKAVIGLRNTSMVSGSFAVVLGASATATSMTGIGVMAGIPLVTVAAVLGVTSVTTAAIPLRLQRRLEKHGLTTPLTKSKLDGISRIISKTLVDNAISDDEYQMVLEALERYREMRSALGPKGRSPAPAGEDSLRRQIAKEIRKELRKKPDLEHEGVGASDTREV